MKNSKYLEKLSGYFQQEISYLSEGGNRFALQYPKLAQRLDLQKTGSSDPHVSRLLESFAFLTAQLQMKIDDEFTVFSSSLLNILYPQLITSIPSTSIVKFTPLPQMSFQLSGTKIPAKTRLLTTSEDGKTCRFQTTMDMELWPLKVSSVDLIHAQSCDISTEILRSSSILRIRVRSTIGELSSLPFEKLCFHLTGDFLTAHTLYEWIFTYDPYESTPIFFQEEGKPSHFLGKHSLKKVGFSPEETLTPTQAQTHHAYQLLLEYFSFPQKFLFFEINNFPIEKSGSFFDLLIPLGERVPGKKIFINENSIQLGCVPVVNLFSKTSEPICLDHKKLEYRLVSDYAQEDITEIHSVLKVSSSSNLKSNTQVYFPYFSLNHHVEKEKNPCFWVVRRSPCHHKNYSGTDLFLSFVDYNLDLQHPQDQTIYSHTLCTNRHLAHLIPAQTLLEIEDSLTGIQALLLERPTAPVAPPLEGHIQWRMLSHLSLNHLGLCTQSNSIKPLQELLRLYCFIDNSPWSNTELALKKIKFHQTMGRISNEAWRGFVPQLSIELTMDTQSPAHNGLYLLGVILDELFRLSSTFNTLIQTSLITDDQQKRLWKRFSPQEANQVPL